jgi:hypothetical protein
MDVDPVELLPVVAAACAVPQFVPQIRKLRRTGDTAGLSTPWALLTGLNNAAWFGYFAASHYWFALIPSSSAATLGGALGVMLQRRRPLPRRAVRLIAAWTLLLVGAALVDRRLLGALLTGAFLIQVVPAVVTAYRTRHPTGIARGTWRLILAEVACWAVFGAANRDGPLMVLGTTGIVSALLMLRRARSSTGDGSAHGEGVRQVGDEGARGGGATVGLAGQLHPQESGDGGEPGVESGSDADRPPGRIAPLAPGRGTVPVARHVDDLAQ